ncbi:hypothetical protein CPC16_011123 [Podila verticillata]|nr:hypothetical protein BGZ52_004347 [Haplosporangium bisporale]KAF9210769.1 hypothetical protein BGZ59_008951 [Podila verticillata]KAF9378799.1 hypothetical protein CPC16_011123 [Podila verticillata]KFH71306.1 hypothetical protein MVEG_01606 [Podila verticillata NRRL 6337]
MTFILKVTSAVVALACAARAVPLGCTGAACYQAAHSGQVDVGSTTNIQPVTNVVPVTRYQPVVQAYAPIVQSECAGSLGSHGLGYGSSSLYGLGRHHPLFMGDSFSPMMNLPLNRAPMFKRRHQQQMRPDCVPSATDSCLVSLDSGTTDLGSNVIATPSNIVLPSTVYQGRVQSMGPEVEAAPEMHHQLKQENVNIESHTTIQPATHVRPEVTYQPEVENKATIVEAESQDASLDRSSASLGSTVTIRPITHVEPLTTFQPKIMSLPFIVKDYACGHTEACDCA